MMHHMTHSMTVSALPSQVSGAAVADAQANAARNGISNATFQQADLDRGMPAAAAGMAACCAPDVVITGEHRPHPAAGIWQNHTRSCAAKSTQTSKVDIQLIS